MAPNKDSCLCQANLRGGYLNQGSPDDKTQFVIQLTEGQTISHFVIERRLGTGGMGSVYLANDVNLDRKVALKCLAPEMAADSDFQARFSREAKVLAKLNHPNIVGIHEFFEFQNRSFITMEYVEGGTLKEAANRSAEEKYQIAVDLACGLRAAHDEGIIHRDIKPANILIDRNNHTKILDFGLAKHGGEDDLTKAGTTVGTYAYMSPEQVKGLVVDKRSDIFSLGIVLYELMIGKRPFEGDFAADIAHKIVSDPPSRLDLSKSNVPPELLRIIGHCLEKNPDDRYQNAQVLETELRSFCLQSEGNSHSSSRLSISQFRSKSRKNQIILLLSALLLLVILGAFWLIRHGRPEQNLASTKDANSLAILGFENKTGDVNLDWLRSGLPEMLLTDLSENHDANIIGQERVVETLGRPGDDIGHFSLDDQTKAARELGAANVLSGVILKLGVKIRVDARLQDASTGKILFSEKVISADTMSVADSLAIRIRSALNLRNESSADQALAQLTTSSPEAYKYYHMGMQKRDIGLDAEAITEFRRAIAIDTGFALAYMRIGLCYAWQGKEQEGVPYFVKAEQLESRLTTHDRSLVQFFSDVYVRVKINDALAQIKNLVDSFPDDREAECIYAQYQFNIYKDTAGAVSLLCSILKDNPKYSLVLRYLLGLYYQMREYDKAIDCAKQFEDCYPESPWGLEALGNLLYHKKEYDQAAEAYKRILEKFPDHGDVIPNLAVICARKRLFREAELYIDKYGLLYQGDHYRLMTYYGLKAGLANWSGSFRKGMAYRFEGLKQARLTEDTSRIADALGDISNYHHYLGSSDSAVFYLRQVLDWTPVWSRYAWALTLVQLARGEADSASVIFERSLADVRSRVTVEQFPPFNEIEKLFKAYVQADSTEIIDISEKLVNSGTLTNSEDLAELCVRFGRFDEGREYFEQLRDERTSSGFYYPYNTYWLGVANEGLGNRKEAVNDYREMLKYWGSPEIEIPVIKDARARLARLTN